MDSNAYDASGNEVSNPFDQGQKLTTDTSRANNKNSTSYNGRPEISAKTTSQFKNLGNRNRFTYPALPGINDLPTPICIPKSMTTSKPIAISKPISTSNSAPISSKVTPSIGRTPLYKNSQSIEKSVKDKASKFNAKENKKKLDLSKVLPKLPLVTRDLITAVAPPRISTELPSEISTKGPDDILIEDSGEHYDESVPNTTGIKDSPIELDMADIPFTQIEDLIDKKVESLKKKQEAEAAGDNDAGEESTTEDVAEEDKMAQIKESNKNIEKLEEISEKIIDGTKKVIATSKAINAIINDSTQAIRKDVEKFIASDPVSLKRKLPLTIAEEPAQKLAKTKETAPVVATIKPTKAPYTLVDTGNNCWVLFMDRNMDPKVKLLMKFDE